MYDQLIIEIEDRRNEATERLTKLLDNIKRLTTERLDVDFRDDMAISTIVRDQSEVNYLYGFIEGCWQSIRLIKRMQRELTTGPEYTRIACKNSGDAADRYRWICVRPQSWR